MGNCPQVNNTCIKGTSAVTYDSTPLPCTDVNTCDGLNTILDKFDTIICDVKESVDILTEQVIDITEDLMLITEDIINIQNQLEICCPTCDFTGTADELLVCDFTGTADQLLDCSFTGETHQVPGPTTTTTSSSTSTSTSTTSSTSTSTSSTSTTTSTTTAAPALGCIEFSENFTVTSQDCFEIPYPYILGGITFDLVDNLGNPVIATEDITITLAFESKQCGDPYPIPFNIPVTINTGTSSIGYGYVQERVYDCGQGECQTETEFFQSIVSISPSSYSLCPETTTTTTTIACASYTVGTTSGTGQTFTYTDCEGLPQSGTIGGVSGFDSQTFCAQLNSVVGTGETATTYNGPCTP